MPSIDMRRRGGGGSNNNARGTSGFVVSISCLTVTFGVLVVVIYTIAAVIFVYHHNSSSSISFYQDFIRRSEEEITIHPKKYTINSDRQYPYWKKIAIELAKLPPLQVYEELNSKDPFGVRTFEKKLLEKEADKGAILDLDDVKAMFKCPTDRITFPDQRNLTKSQEYRANKGGTFLFFQHLRKAGGTNFCKLAQDNLPEHAVGRYYCMSDWFWTHDNGDKSVGAGYLMHWTNEEMVKRMTAKGHRVIGNEWDNFDRYHHFDLPATLATSFRKPMHRALSQFRFECIEDRGCQIKDPGKWWNHRQDLSNIYTTTFATFNIDRKTNQAFLADSDEDSNIRAQLLGDALDTVIRFHLVLNMEWLAYAKPLVRSVLGFTNMTSLTHRVRPHINQYNRSDGQEVNQLGAAGIAKASWTPEEFLTPTQYEQFQLRLALDEILTDAARRIFLERLVCTDLE